MRNGALDWTSTNQIAQEIKKQLTKKGVNVQIHRSRTTKSIYMRFDYGVLNQCRVSDHQGRGYAFKYEIGTHVNQKIENHHWNGRTTERIFFHASQVNRLVEKVLYHRSNLRAKYGKDNYDKFLEEGKKKEWKY